MALVRDIDTSLLRAFLAVVDTGNFSRAARQLNRTQGALSMQIKRLEELVDAPLFERSVRPPLLTHAGEHLVAYAREILSISDAALETIRRDRLAGQVRLALMEDYASHRVVRLLRDFSERHPDVQIDVCTGNTYLLVDRVGVDFDILLAMLPPGVESGDALFRGRCLWGASQDFDPKNHEMLPLALYQQGCLFRKWATQALDNAGRRWRTGFVSCSHSAIVAAVQEGWCISVFKSHLLPRGLRALTEADGLPALPDFEVRIVRAPAARTGAAKALADYLARELHGAHDHSLAA